MILHFPYLFVYSLFMFFFFLLLFCTPANTVIHLWLLNLARKKMKNLIDVISPCPLQVFLSFRAVKIAHLK
jgi:hypothetical protein